MSVKGFNRVAPFYDGLARLVFGSAIMEAQLHFITEINAKDKVLILGGGTGWILKELQTRKPYCEIVYVETSSAMMTRAKRNVLYADNVTFFNWDIGELEKKEFNVVIAPFFFDLFSQSTLKKTIRVIQERTAENSKWIVTDFIDNGTWWQGIMLSTMILFFRIMARMKAKELPKWKEELVFSGLTTVSERSFYRNFIVTALFKSS